MLRTRNAQIADDRAVPGVVVGDLGRVAAARAVAADAVCGGQPRRHPLKRRRWSGSAANVERKLHNAMPAFPAARLWPGVCSNVLEPGWVVTRMGGWGTGRLGQAQLTRSRLAAGDDPGAARPVAIAYHMTPLAPHPEGEDVAFQDRMIGACRGVSGGSLPGWRG